MLVAALLFGLVHTVADQPSQWVSSAICRIFQGQHCSKPGGGTTAASNTPPATPASSPTTKAGYQKQLCQQLQLDCKHWHPSQGLSCNDSRFQEGYAYYQHEYDRHPELQWAGMAKLAGGTVYGGAQDLHVLRGMSKDERLRWLGSAAGGMPKPLVDAIANAGSGELKYYEGQLATIQRNILLDLGWQHAAYDDGGIQKMRQLYKNNQINADQLSTWEDIASKDPERVKRGNKALVLREQYTIAQPNWSQMENHNGLLGKAVTYMIGVAAESPVPGGKPFRDVVTPKVKLPGGIVLKSPLPTGNIATFNSRWQWITQDMLPQYNKDLDDYPQATKRSIDKPLSDRAKYFRTVPPGLAKYNPKDGLC